MVSRRPKYDHRDDTIEINRGRVSVTLEVTNTGDRPVQVGSHFHFFEANPALLFEREQSWGRHLDIPAGTGVRFEPGEMKQVTLVDFAGTRHLVGFGGLVNGGLDSAQTKADALRRLADQGYANVESGHTPAESKRSADSKHTTEPKKPSTRKAGN